MFRVTLLAFLASLYSLSASAVQWEEEPSIMGEWAIYFGTSQLDDSQAVFAQIWDDWRGHNSSNLELQTGCIEGRPFVNFVITYQDEFIENDLVSVAYRIDKNPAVRQVWARTTDRTSVIIQFDDARELLSELLSGDELFIRAEPSNLSGREARFLLLGVREIIYQVAKMCPEEN